MSPRELSERAKDFAQKLLDKIDNAVFDQPMAKMDLAYAGPEPANTAPRTVRLHRGNSGREASHSQGFEMSHSVKMTEHTTQIQSKPQVETSERQNARQAQKLRQVEQARQQMQELDEAPKPTRTEAMTATLEKPVRKAAHKHNRKITQKYSDMLTAPPKKKPTAKAARLAREKRLNRENDQEL